MAASLLLWDKDRIKLFQQRPPDPQNRKCSLSGPLQKRLPTSTLYLTTAREIELKTKSVNLANLSAMVEEKEKSFIFLLNKRKTAPECDGSQAIC